MVTGVHGYLGQNAVIRVVLMVGKQDRGTAIIQLQVLEAKIVRGTILIPHSV